MKSVFIAGATGYLGRHLCAEYARRGWYVTALVRDAGRAGDLAADSLVEAQATEPETLRGAMQGADLVVSALGITRQSDGLSYRDVDYQANLNLLTEAKRAGVQRFAYVHVLHADRMLSVPLVAAKEAFVRALRGAAIQSTVIAPTGYFSDMGDLFKMAQSGRVWLFGDGQNRINPIHGADLAAASFEAVEAGRDWLDVGGPDLFTQTELAELAFQALGKKPKITCMPDCLRKLALKAIPYVMPRNVAGPAQFFLTALGQEMIGERHGTHHLADHFAAMAREDWLTP
jgi:uncharacterized protein YbjT (DUF2867 family)